MNDRIKLAEAMGWKPRPPSETQYDSYTWASPYWKDGKQLAEYPRAGYSFCFEWQLPDPENDANDDYAVLEWMRKPDKDGCWTGPNADDFIKLIDNGHPEDYKIGDYARAALKVIDCEKA